VFDHTSPDLVSAIMASSAFPGMFPPIEIDGKWYTDGGLLDTRPMRYALTNQCEKALVIMTRDPFAKKVNPRPTNVLLRGRIEMDSMCDYLYARDVQKCMQINRVVVDDAGVADTASHRNMPVTWIYPSKELASPMDFDYDTIQRQIEFGVQDARRFFE
jgi:predicted acylesterase/phospholipase RssA